MGRARAGMALVAALTAWGCAPGEGEAGPDFRQARLTLESSPAGPAMVGIASAEGFRIVLTRLGGEVAYDSGIRSLTSSSVTLELPVDYTPPSELLRIEVRVFDAAGAIIFRGGPTDITVGGGTEDVPVDLALRYEGVGSNAASVDVTPRERTVWAGQITSFEARALDEDGAPIPGTPIVWSSGDVAIGRVQDQASGRVMALRAGTVEITARLLTDIEESATLTVEADDGAPLLAARLFVRIESEVADTRVRSVAADPSIDCYTTGTGAVLGGCSGDYPRGSSVTLRATVDGGAEAGFVRWTDGSGTTLSGCPGIDPCTIEVVGGRTVSAHFVAGVVRRFLTIRPAIVEPADQASTEVTMSTRVFDPEGGRLAGAPVVFRSVGGCFRWSDPRPGEAAETVATSGSDGVVEVTGRACVEEQGGARDPIVGVRLAGSAKALREYRLAVANDLPSDALIVPLSDTDQTIACGDTPGDFVVAVHDGRARRLPDVPVVWNYQNEFAYRTTTNGTSTSRYAEPVSCRVEPHQVRATILTDAGSRFVTFTVRVEGS